MIQKDDIFGVPTQRGNVTVYPATPPELLRTTHGKKTKTAAYVRVSTDSEQQEGSLALQKEYYETLIKSNPEYEFVAIYDDEGISGTNVDKRKGFLRMIEDCKTGKIDLILAKDISRFTRNLGDLLNYVNILNSLNPPVEIYFETNKLSTFGATGEILLMVLGLCAQEESRHKSESITWAIDNLFAQGKYYIPPIYGYTKENGRDKPLIINEEEAKVVRLCYAMMIKGCSLSKIIKVLNSFDITGRKWNPSSLISLLTHEKYAGNLWVRKTVTPNYKTHKSKKNEGEKPKYFVEDNHEPIVPPLAHKLVINILKNKKRSLDGLPFLTTVNKGILKGFVVVNKNVRNYTLEDYIEASCSISRIINERKISIEANKFSVFDFRNFESVSSLLFNDISKPSCTIIKGKISFNLSCRKIMSSFEFVEMLFDPVQSILALRSSKNKKTGNHISLYKSIHISSFTPIALESADLDIKYKYRFFGTKRDKGNETILLFSLREAIVISDSKDKSLLPSKYAHKYGDDYYENITKCNLHKIDIEGLWEAMQESKPHESVEAQLIELTEFCQKSFTAFGLEEDIVNEQKSINTF